MLQFLSQIPGIYLKFISEGINLDTKLMTFDEFK